jgi:putative transposase
LRLLYVFVVIHCGSRRLLRLNITTHPIAAPTPQQLREVPGFEDAYRYLLHYRDSESIKSFGLRVLKSPREDSHEHRGEDDRQP